MQLFLNLICSGPVPALWGLLGCLSHNKPVKGGMLFDPFLKWGPANRVISEVQWAWVALSFPCPLVLFPHLFSSFLCFDTSGIVGSSPVRKQHYQNMSNFSEKRKSWVISGPRRGWKYLTSSNAWKAFLMKTELHTGCSGGPLARDLEKPLVAKCTGNYLVVALRLPCLELPWRRSLLTMTPELAQGSWIPPWLCSGSRMCASSGSCPHFSHSSIQALLLGLYFFPSAKAHTDGVLSATIKGLRWVMENGRTWHVLVCLSAIFP